MCARRVRTRAVGRKTGGGSSCACGHQCIHTRARKSLDPCGGVTCSLPPGASLVGLSACGRRPWRALAVNRRGSVTCSVAPRRSSLPETRELPDAGSAAIWGDWGPAGAACTRMRARGPPPRAPPIAGGLGGHGRKAHLRRPKTAGKGTRLSHARLSSSPQGCYCHSAGGRSKETWHTPRGKWAP